MDGRSSPRQPGEDLALAAPLAAGRNWLGALELGYVRTLARAGVVELRLGGARFLGLAPGALEPMYGTRTPVGGMVFVRLSPSARH